MIQAVFLTLIVWNTATGDKLHELEVPFGDRFSVSGNPIEDCRLHGVRMAHKLVEHYQRKYPYASANVDCEWRLTPGAPA